VRDTYVDAICPSMRNQGTPKTRSTPLPGTMTTIAVGGGHRNRQAEQFQECEREQRQIDGLLAVARREIVFASGSQSGVLSDSSER
jgi:hypothetical protein